MRRLFTRHLYLPLTQRLQGEKLFENLKQFEQSQWLPSEGLLELQWRTAYETVNWAYRQIPFYRDSFDGAGVNPEKLECLQDFQSLPLLTKDQVRQNYDSLRSPGADLGECEGQTSGSTGAPLRFNHGRTHRSRHEAGQWRARGWFGVRLGDPVLAVWGRPVDTAREWRLLQLKSFLNNIIHVSAFELDPASIGKLHGRLRRFRPRLVYGYPSGIYEIARQAEEDGLRLDDLGVRLVACTAEILHGFQRELLERVFGAPVADVYGCGEFGAFAHQCPKQSMHISCENLLVEFLDEQGRPVEPGQPGEVVVTGFHNPGMPLIRYRVGDVGVPLEPGCPCGRGLPRMDIRAGKAGQMVRTSGGRMFSTELFDYVNKRLVAAGLRGLSSFHVVQYSLDGFTVQYVPGARDVEQTLAVFETGMREVVGPDARVDFEALEEIPRHPGGKIGYFTCTMKATTPKA